MPLPLYLLKGVIMEIYQDTNSTYDEDLKLAIPTLEYIKSITGYNLEVLGGMPSAIDTEQRVKGLSLSAKDDLYLRIPLKIDKNVMDYLIATEKDWRRDFINYVVAYVNATFSYGEFEDMPARVYAKIQSSLINARKFTNDLRCQVNDLEW